jgi:hypothetical protein
MIVRYGKIEFEFGKSTVYEGFQREKIVKRLKALDGGDDDREASYRIFARLCTQTKKVKGLWFELPAAEADDQTLTGAWTAWLKAEEDLEMKCLRAFGALIEPYDEATGPDAPGKDAPKNS